MKLIVMGLSLLSWVMILCCKCGDHWGSVGRVLGVVGSAVVMIGVLLQVWCWWIFVLIFMVSLSVG